MQRRRKVRTGFAVGIAVVAISAWFVFRSDWRRPRFNVLLVTLDTTRADHIGCYGYSHAHTPTLDALAREGVLFENAYATVPMTLPSHAGMLTGLYPPECGLHNNGNGRLGAGFPTLAETLVSAGYEAAAFVAAVVLRSQTGLDRGFHVYDEEMAGGERYGDETHLMRSGKLVVDAALKWLTERASRPFFCWVHLYDPHAPFEGHAETFGDRFRERPYDGDIAFADVQVGRLIEFLKSRNLYERTVIVVVGDHGEGFGEHNEIEHGFLLYNSTMRVPLIVRAPEKCQAGHRAPAPVSLVDLYPTILDTVRLPLSHRVSGASLQSALQGLPVEPHDCYAETDSTYISFGWAPLRSVTTDRWKFIHSTRDELFDLEEDPGELHNLVESQPQQLTAMRDRLAALEQQMVESPESDLRLTAKQRRELASLGYVTGLKGGPPSDSTQPLPDVKDMIGFYNAEFEARGLLSAGKADEAIDRLRSVIDAAPDFMPARLTLGSALRMKNLPDEATEVYEAALKANPESSQVRFDLARHLYSLGKTEESASQYRAVLKIEPSDSMAHFNLATILVGQGNPADARKHYELGLEAFPDSIVGQFNYGVFLNMLGDLPGALRHVGRALELNPRDPQIHFQMGLLRGAMGEYGRAAGCFEETLRLNSRFPKAQEQLDRARKNLPPLN